MLRPKKHLRGLYRPKFSETRKGLLRLDMNESVSGLPGKFVKSVLKRITAEEISAYPEYPELERKIARRFGLKEENVLLSNGSDGAIKYIFEAFISPGDRVVYTDPTFAMYPVYCSIFEAKGEAVRYRDDLVFPAEDFLRAIKRGCRMAVIVNPNNPTGSVLGLKELEKIARVCRKRDVLLIIDEAYLYSKGAEEMVGRYKNICILRTFSKFCGMAGLRLGFCLADKSIIEGLRKVRPTFDVNSAAVIFAEALLDSPKVVSALVLQAERGRRYIKNELAKNHIEYRDCGANFILIKCSGRAEKIAGALKKKGVLVGSGFKQDFLKDYIRVTIGAVPEMKRFFKRFITIIGKR